MKWQQLEMAEPTELAEATHQLHHAAQLCALVGKHLVPQQPDDSNTNLEWNPELEMLFGSTVGGKVRVGLSPGSFALAVDRAQSELALFGLDGRTFAEAFDWLRSVLQSEGIDTRALTQELHYEIPKHAIDDGAAFTLTSAAHFGQMARHRANADSVIREWAKRFERTEPVRTWPHHFDTGTYATLETDADDNLLRSISIGLAVADSVCDQHYWYVTAWAQNDNLDRSDLPALPSGGYWDPNDFVGAVLPTFAVAQLASAAEQAEAVNRFLTAAVNASLKFHGLPPLG